MQREQVALDENVSPKLANALSALYGRDRFEFISVKEFSAPGAQDEAWAAKFKKQGGRVVISGDVNIGKRPRQAAAFLANGFLCFFPSGSWGQLRAHAKSAFLIHCWPRVAKVVESSQSAACWRIRCLVRKKVLHLSDDDFEAMIIPPGVLATAGAGDGRA